MNLVINIERQLARGPRTSAELAAVSGVTVSAVTRAISSMPAVIQMGRARAARYGLLDSIRGLPATTHPVYRIGSTGDVAHIGNIAAIVGGEFWYENLEEPSRSRAFDDLPWFLQDLRPQGFLGRATVRHFATLGWPADLALWSDRDVFSSILQSPAHDHIGNLLVGELARHAYDISRHPLQTGLPVDSESRIARYQNMVQRMGEGAIVGTSVNGEQPKFCASVSIPDSNHLRHVLVKFSAPLSTEAGLRWSDLLVMEGRCLNRIREDLGIPAASATYMTCGTRAYLEIDRFDRTAAGGRQGVISFASLDAEFVGLGTQWMRVAKQLVSDGHLDADAIRIIAVLDYFATLVGNTDRHLGNISVYFGGTRPMTLTPIYDFLPMCYAPTTVGMSSAQLVPASFLNLEGSTLDLETQELIERTARRFWEECSQDQRISPAMRQLCSQNIVVVTQELALRRNRREQSVLVDDSIAREDIDPFKR